MALIARSTGLNQKVGTGRRRNRKANERAKEQEKAFNRARDAEMQRQQAARRQAMEQEVFATAEGGGIQEQANISLGTGEDEDDLFDQFGTGLII